MQIDNCRGPLNTPASFCHSELDAPQLSVDIAPSISTGAGITRKLASNDSILNTAVYYRALAEKWQLAFLCERQARLDRDGHPETNFSEYRVAAVDEAREDLKGWTIRYEPDGGLKAERQS